MLPAIATGGRSPEPPASEPSRPSALARRFGGACARRSGSAKRTRSSRRSSGSIQRRSRPGAACGGRAMPRRAPATRWWSASAGAMRRCRGRGTSLRTAPAPSRSAKPQRPPEPPRQGPQRQHNPTSGTAPATPTTAARLDDPFQEAAPALAGPGPCKTRSRGPSSWTMPPSTKRTSHERSSAKPSSRIAMRPVMPPRAMPPGPLLEGLTSGGSPTSAARSRSTGGSRRCMQPRQQSRAGSSSPLSPAISRSPPTGTAS